MPCQTLASLGAVFLIPEPSKSHLKAELDDFQVQLFQRAVCFLCVFVLLYE
jgi:hypothetical protein